MVRCGEKGSRGVVLTWQHRGQLQRQRGRDHASFRHRQSHHPQVSNEDFDLTSQLLCVFVCVKTWTSSHRRCALFLLTATGKCALRCTPLSWTPTTLPSSGCSTGGWPPTCRPEVSRVGGQISGGESAPSIKGFADFPPELKTTWLNHRLWLLFLCQLQPTLELSVPRPALSAVDLLGIMGNFSTVSVWKKKP